MLKQQIQSDTTYALKQGDSETATVLRLIVSSINSKEKEKRYKEKLEKDPELSDDEIISVLASEVKKRKDAIALYEKGGRPELAEKEKKEIEIIKKYLPEQLSPDELKNLVEESINKVGAKEIKDMGKVMAYLAPKIKGKADGGEVSKIIKEFLLK